MDATAFRASVESAKATELDRLGSSKLLVALTDADLSEDAVLRAAAFSEYLARETFESWAADETVDAANEVFADVAAQEAEHYERVVDALGDPVEPESVGPMHAYLRDRDDAVERAAAGLVGRGLVSLRTHLQIVSFFVNEADDRTADLFRDLRSETEESLSAGLDLLDAVCEDDADWDAAKDAADAAIQAAYDEYTEQLEAMGVNPKPVC